jgi:hypothetical protein
MPADHGFILMTSEIPRKGSDGTDTAIRVLPVSKELLGRAFSEIAAQRGDTDGACPIKEKQA